MQILGAEKALFRALKTRGNTPKYGLIFHSTFIGRAKQRNKGRISRYLANKCSIASRIDCFMDVATSAFGERLKEQVADTQQSHAADFSAVGRLNLTCWVNSNCITMGQRTPFSPPLLCETCQAI